MKIEPREFPLFTLSGIDENARVRVNIEGKIHSLGVPNPLPSLKAAQSYYDALHEALVYLESVSEGD